MCLYTDSFDLVDRRDNGDLQRSRTVWVSGAGGTKQAFDAATSHLEPVGPEWNLESMARRVLAEDSVEFEEVYVRTPTDEQPPTLEATIAAFGELAPPQTAEERRTIAGLLGFDPFGEPPIDAEAHPL